MNWVYHVYSPVGHGVSESLSKASNVFFSLRRSFLSFCTFFFLYQILFCFLSAEGCGSTRNITNCINDERNNIYFKALKYCCRNNFLGKSSSRSLFIEQTFNLLTTAYFNLKINLPRNNCSHPCQEDSSQGDNS